MNRCPKCGNAVYAAEQALGPGRLLYHKPCLACVSCNKRLDSYTLLEHDEKPYCKSCHKNFGTRDLRQANLPHRENVAQSTFPASPKKSTFPLPSISPARSTSPTRVGSPTRMSFSSPIRQNFTGRGQYTPTYGHSFNQPTSPVPKPNRTFSPATPSRALSPPPDRPPQIPAWDDEEEEKRDSFLETTSDPSPPSPSPPLRSEALNTLRGEAITESQANAISASYANVPAPTRLLSNSSRGANGLPRTVPLTPSHLPPPAPAIVEEAVEEAQPAEATPPDSFQRQPQPETAAPSSWSSSGNIPTHTSSRSLDNTPRFTSTTLGRSNSVAAPLAPTSTGTPLAQTATGTRFGVGSARFGAPQRQFGGGTPLCPRCTKSVYFAEQVKAIGQTWHRACLRCTECGTSLDSTRLTEKDGQPLCHRCYSKLHGPQGSGYALLGKAGG